MRSHAPNQQRNAALKKSSPRSLARITPSALLPLVAALLSLCAASTAADASSAVCSPNVSWYFAQPIASGTPAVGTLCSLPTFYTFTLAAPAAVTVQVTSSSGAPSNASDPLLTHQLLGADFAPIAPTAAPVFSAQTYTLDAGDYGIRVAGLSLNTALYSALPYTLSLSEAAVSGDCATAVDDTATAPITTFPAQLTGALCTSGDTDTFGFYIDHPARLTFASSDAVQVLANDTESGGAVILGNGEGAAPATVLFQPGNHLLVVSSPPLGFFSGNYTISIAEDTSVALPAECNRTDSLRTAVTLPFETSFTQCSYSDRAEFRFGLSSAQVITIQFVDSAPGIAALRTESGQLVAYAFRSGEVSQDFYLPAGNYTLQVPAWSDGQALPIDPISEPQNGTLRITAASAACPAGVLQAGAASSDQLPTVPSGQPVTLCANATDNLIAGAPTSVWFALDSTGDSTFTDVNVNTVSVVTSTVAYDVTGSGYPLPAVLPAGRFRVELGLARSQPFITLNVTQTDVNTAGTTVQLPATISGSTGGILPNVYFFSLPNASRISINSQLVQDATDNATTGVLASDLLPRPLVVRLFERCGWLDVCALYGNARVATDFYPGIFPTGKFQVNLPLNQDTTVDLASGEYGIEVSGFRPRPVNYTVTVSDASAVGCRLDASEPNDSPATATNFTLNSTVSATFCPSNDRDFYSFTLASTQRLTITYNGSVDSSLFVVNRLDASRLLQITSPSAATTVVLAEGVWLVLVAPAIAVANSTSPDAPALDYTLTIDAADEQCIASAQSAVVSALPFAGNVTQLCAASAATSANTSLTLSNATVVDILVLSPAPLAWVLSNATGAPMLASNKPKETLSLLPGTYTVAVFGSSFNTSQFQLFIVPSNASTAACLPDQYAANTDRENAAQVALPFIATLTSCGGSGDWFAFTTAFLSRLTITASRTAEAFAAAASGDASSGWSTDVCFVLYQSNDTVPLFTSCGAASHTLPPATYALSVLGGGAPFNLTVSAVPAVGVRQSGFATSLRVSIALVLVAASALLSML